MMKQKENTFSVVMPVHNEEMYLPYSLAGLRKCPIDELIVILDRCSDNSEKILNSVCFPFDVKVIKKDKQAWRCPTAEVFEIGFRKAKGDIIFVGAGDLIYTPEMFRVEYFNKSDLVMFFYWSYDILGKFQIRQQFLNFMKQYFTFPLRSNKKRFRSGVFGCKRELWEKVHFRDVPSEYDDLHSRALKQGFRTDYVKGLPIFHLRVGLTKSRQYLQGMSRAHSGYSPLKVFLHSLVFMKPYLWLAYYQERKYGLYKKQKWTKEGYEKTENPTLDLCSECKGYLLNLADCSGGEKGAYNKRDLAKQKEICARLHKR